MNYEDLTQEQRERAKACTTPEELMELARSEGVELTDEQLNAISGGSKWGCDDHTCDKQVRLK